MRPKSVLYKETSLGEFPVNAPIAARTAKVLLSRQKAHGSKRPSLNAI